MTEKQHIYSKALGTVTAAINVLRDLVPANLNDIILPDEYPEAMNLLCNWQERLFDKINTTENGAE